MSVAHNFPSQKHSRNLHGGLRIAGLAVGGLCAIVLLRPLGVSAETQHNQPQPVAAQVEMVAANVGDAAKPQAQPARKPVRVIQIWNIPEQQNQKN